jgi:cytochrome c6
MRSLLIVAGLSVVVLGGCGGDGVGSVSPEEYLQEFQSTAVGLDEAVGELEGTDIPTKPAALAETLDRLSGKVEKLSAQTDALNPPPEVKDAHDNLVEALQGFSVWLHELALKVRSTPASKLRAVVESELSGQTDPTRPILQARRDFSQEGYDLAGGKVYAANGPGDPDAGREVFTGAAGCAACHTLADAEATGVIGPSLDIYVPPYGKIIERVTDGGGAMPGFRTTLSEEQINDVAAYVLSVEGR